MGRLTTLSRVKARFGFPTTASAEDVLDNGNEDIKLDAMIGALSSQVENFCHCQFLKTTYTQHFAFPEGKRQFNVRAYPISSVTSVAVDFTGQFNGSQTTLGTDTYWVQPEYEYEWNRTVVLNLNPVWVVAPMLSANRLSALRIIYVGGLAEHATTFTCTITGTGGTVAANDEVTGPAGNGIVKTVVGATITIEILVGTFSALDSITNGTWVRTISVKSTATLLEVAPDLVDAVETQIRWQWKMMTDPGMKTTEQGRTDRFTPSDMNVSYEFLPEVRSALKKYVNRMMQE